MQLCTLDDLTNYIHAGYMAACEQQNPGLAERLIDGVSGEIPNLLARRYPLPWPFVPSLLRHIAAVFAAYRMAGAITTLVKSASQSENEWIPLQMEYKRCDALLKDIATGKTKLAFGDEEIDEEFEEPSITVISPGKHFDLKGF
jgi:phage gp36-like protein